MTEHEAGSQNAAQEISASEFAENLLKHCQGLDKEEIGLTLFEGMAKINEKDFVDITYHVGELLDVMDKDNPNRENTRLVFNTLQNMSEAKFNTVNTLG